MEYLTSGKPIISTRFAGYQRFNDNILFVDSDAEALVEGMRTMAAYSDAQYEQQYRQNRAKAREYLWDSQVERIQRLLCS